jgi:hypothetical protein
MTSDLALYKFGLFLLGIFAVMLTLTLAFKRTPFFADIKITDLLGAVFTLALAGFTLALVAVAARQTDILSNTDKALHAAATAQTEAAHTAEKLRLFTEATNRAWLGPVSAHSEPFEDGKPVKITISFNNTGRLPATFKFGSGGNFFTRDYWEDGRANAKIDSVKSLCMKGLPSVEQAATQQGLAYPTTGFSSYTVTYESTRTTNNRFVLTQPDLGADHIFAVIGCFVYSDIFGSNKESDHHSFFCYYRDAEAATDVNQLLFCPSEQAAD